MDTVSAAPCNDCATPTVEPSLAEEPAERESAAATQPLVEPEDLEPSAQLVASRPSVDFGCSAEQWDSFMNQWARFAAISELDDEQLAPQCRACLTGQLRDAVSSSYGDGGSRGGFYHMNLKDLLPSSRLLAFAEASPTGANKNPASATPNSSSA